jgi:hypothetical protein
MAQSTVDTSPHDSLLERIEAADDLVRTGRRATPVTIGGKEYKGIMDVPVEELALCSSADYEAMRPAHRSHRSRRLRTAARDGTFSPEQVRALKAKGVLPINS